MFRVYHEFRFGELNPCLFREHLADEWFQHLAPAHWSGLSLSFHEPALFHPHIKSRAIWRDSENRGRITAPNSLPSFLKPLLFFIPNSPHSHRKFLWVSLPRTRCTPH